jgi:phosphatidylinositol-3-phosphatase
MNRSRHRLAALLLTAFASLLLIASSASAEPAAPRTHSHGQAPRHIFYIMMENHGYSEIIGNRADAPFVNGLAARAGLATDYYGVTHPSLPNYLAAISGSFQGIWDDCQAGAAITCPPEEFIPTAGDGTAGNYLTPAEITSASATPHLFAGANIVDQLQAHHVTWRAYMQGLPSAGSEVVDAPTVETSTGPEALALYVQKHNPFMYFSDINYPGSPRLHQIVPLHRLASNLRSGHVPDFVWISPDTCHDMHGIDPASAALIGLPSCGYPASGLDHGAIRLGDRFLRRTVRTITHSRTWRTTRSSIVITWDEDDYSGFSGTSTSPVGVGGVILGGAQVPTIVLNSRGSHHQVFDQPANHYNLLATIERMWHLGCLANTCSIPRSQLLTPLFR